MSKFKIGDRVRSLASPDEGEVLAVDSRGETVKVSWDSGFQSIKYADKLRLIDDGNASDAVNPAHYKRFPVEVIELTEHLNFCRGSAVKYLVRAGHKPGADEIEDLDKAIWYIQREKQRIEALKPRAEIVRDK